MPCYLYLDDGRLLTWFHQTSTGEVSAFRLTVDRDVGQGPIDMEAGLRILAEYRRRLDGTLLGPMADARAGALGRRARGRRSR
jgi:hypothetical protein